VPRDVLLERLAGRSTDTGPGGRRSDDRPDIIARRLDVYERQTAPVREYYRQRQVLHEIDGDRPVADVTRQILTALGQAPTIPDR
jgi:adenylate kinase